MDDHAGSGSGGCGGRRRDVVILANNWCGCNVVVVFVDLEVGS